MATTIRSSQSEGMSTGAYENYQRLLHQQHDEEEDDYVQRCCCCESMSYARVLGIYSTLISLLALWIRLKAAVTQALVFDFSDLMLDHMIYVLFTPILCAISMILVAFSFKLRKGNLLYGPMILHVLVIVLHGNSAISLLWFRATNNALAKRIFKYKLDDLAIDHPGRTYEDLYEYLMHDIGQDTIVGGVTIAIQIPFNLAFIMVCWRLRAHLEQQEAALKARETKAMKIREENMKKID